MLWLLDTVTISELRKRSKAHPAVIAWQKSNAGQVGHLSVISMNEIHYGTRRIEQRDPLFAAKLRQWFQEILDAPSLYKIIPVDLKVARIAADFRADHNTAYNDSLIAATAAIHDLTVATRNTSDFSPTGVPVFNPWEFGAEKYR